MAIKVLIVDDSMFFRRRLSEILNADPRLDVIATAANGQEALDQIKRQRPDVITMDLEMPVMDGITAVRKIMASQPTPVLMLSSWTTEGAKSTLDALDAGAVDFLPKRLEDLSGDHTQSHSIICDRVHQIARSFRASKFVSPVVKPQTNISSKQQSSIKDKEIQLVAIGTSTGGPVALQKVLTQLPATFPHPILLIQHMPATFTPSFAERLNTQCAIKVKEAANGDQLNNGTAYLAPGGKQLIVRGRQQRLYLEIQEGQPDQTYKPCIDLTLHSIARICPDKTLSIILTGMGSDGCKGSEDIHQKGGLVWAQDQESSTIYGMPLAVAKAGIADKILSITDIGKNLADLSL